MRVMWTVRVIQTSHICVHWYTLQEYIRRIVKPANKDELIQGIQQFWDTVDVQKCRQYISHLRKVLPRIVELDGDATGF